MESATPALPALSHAEIAAEFGAMIDFERKSDRCFFERNVDALSPASREWMEAQTARRLAALMVAQAYFSTIAGLTEASMACGPLAIINGGKSAGRAT